MQNIDSIVRLDQPEILDGRDLVKQVLLNRLNFSNEGYAFIKKLEEITIMFKIITLDSNNDFILVPNHGFSVDFMDEYLAYLKSQEQFGMLNIFKKRDYEFRVNGKNYKLNNDSYLCCCECRADVHWYQGFIADFYNWDAMKLEDGEWLKTGYSKTKHLFGN